MYRLVCWREICSIFIQTFAETLLGFGLVSFCSIILLPKLLEWASELIVVNWIEYNSELQIAEKKEETE